MARRRICISLAWDPRRVDTLLARARAADEAGVETLWVNEGFGHDAFSALTLLAWETSHIQLGSGIVNVFSRTPGALAQHFATLDQLSEGRIIVGLGTSGQGVIERFHGMPYRKSIQRLRETVELLRAFWGQERITYHGDVFDLERGLPLGVEPVRPAAPMYLATLHPRSVQMTAEVADGWLPVWIPTDRLASEIARVREWARAAGRDPDAFTVRAPGSVTVVNDPQKLEAARGARAQNLAFFVARNGDFYYRQFGRHGLADEAAAIKRAWDEGGREAGVAAVPAELPDRFDFVGDTEQCIERLEAQAEMGVDLHPVTVVEDDPDVAAKVLEQLAGG
ncbi:MAG: LLM class flavin-dependent oxidoreductase [Dehalococcoidia bacterium]